MSPMEEKLPDSPSRITYLEGLRGCAAFAVMISHLVLAFFPAAVYHSEEFNWRALGLSGLLINSPLAVLFDGPLAVRIFFIHSGLVLSYRFFRGDQNQELITRSALGRYFRLTPPLAVSVFLAYAVLASGAMRHLEVAQITESFKWLNSLYGFDASLWQATKQAFWGSYFSFNSDLSYNPNLWTIQTELFGSFLVYAFLTLFGRFSVRWLMYLVSILVFWETDYLAFVVGMIFCDLYHRFQIYRLNRPSLITKLNASIILLAGIWLGGFVTPLAPFYTNVDPSSLGLPPNQLKLFGSAAIIGALMFLPLAQAFLNSKLIQYLGKISYALYLVHIPIICSVGCQIFLLCFKDWHYSYSNSALIASLAVGLTSIAIAHLLRLSVDEPAIRLGRWIGAKLISIRFYFPFITAKPKQ